MKLYEGLESFDMPGRPASTVAIGAFDGIHVGHQAIIRAAVEDAAEHGRLALVLTFDRHPAELLAPERAPEYLTTPEQRNQLVAQLGAAGLIVARFDRALANLSPEAFISEVLNARLSARSIVVGTNFAFGRNRAGDVEFLRVSQGLWGFELHALEPVTVEGAPASSTRVRELLRAGNIREAEQVLGHGYWLSGIVVEGQKLGRQLGYPTANLQLQCRQVVPLDGIYAVRVRLWDGRELAGACSIGERPTIEGAGRSIETYLLSFQGDLYGSEIEIRFVQRLRPEMKFESIDALKEQMALDVAEVERLLRAEPDA